MPLWLRLPVLWLGWLSCSVQSLSPLHSTVLLPSGGDEPPRPKWPEQYKVAFTFSVPYVKHLQTAGLVYNYSVWRDSEHGRQKVVRDGVETQIEVVDKNKLYQVYPRYDWLACSVTDIDSGKGPTRRRRSLLAPQPGGDPWGATRRKPQLSFVLPDVTEARWAFSGRVAQANGPPALLYRFVLEEDEGYGHIVADYNFTVTPDGRPMRLHMFGINLYTGGHFDEYTVSYQHWQPGAIDDSQFSIPDICKDNAVEELLPAHKASSIKAHLATMLPNPHWGDGRYDAFVHKFGRRHGSREEYDGRRQVFAESAVRVQEHNARGASFTMELNHFADWTQEEFEAIMLPNRGQPRPAAAQAGQAVRHHKPVVPPHMLPTTVDWRGSPADSPVKDQAACGSCWAFGAIASLETAYFRATGRARLLSEQHLMDCAWATGNTACMGGYQNLALQWALDVEGGVAAEEDYPYKGVTDWCRQNASVAAKFKGEYVEVGGGEVGLMEALLTRGPMTVSVDAAPESFRFYSAGVYNDSACHSKLEKLDHAVIVSGYGRTEDGKDYWIVKNTWSPFWGSAGYILIARRPHDCGIATQPIYVDAKVVV